jgi:nucleoside-diphosphate-sugar epimerase
MELKNSTVFITGATGLVGGRLAERLVREENARVRALVRTEKKAAQLEKEMAGLAIEPVLGDLANLDALRRGAADCQFVFHCAAWVSDRGTRDDFFRANVTGTDNVVKAAQAGGCQRFIHTSSVAVYGLNPRDGTDESFPFDTSNNLYCETKIESEQVVKRAMEKERLAAVIIRPGSVYGPRSATWTLRPIKALKDKKLFLIGGGKGLCNYVYIDNLVDGMLQAARNDRAVGEDFIITDGQAAPWREFFGYYNQMLGRDQMPSLPLPVAQLVALGMEMSEKITGSRPVLSRSAVGFLTRQAVFNISKAKTQLGYQPKISLAEGMKMTEQWLRAEKII